MATFTENIKIVLKGAGKAGKDAKKVSSAMKGLATTALAAGAAYFGTRGIINGLTASIDLFKKQEMAERKLQAALGFTSRALLNQATALQKSTMFGDEAIIEAQALIGAFVREESAIKAATKATLDLAAAKGMDLVVAADLVSKTLGSSTNALSRYGIQVEGAVGSTERLNSLTGNLAEVFGGQAVAQADTFAGSLEQLDNSFGDLGERIGSKFAPMIQDLAGLFSDLIDVPLSDQMNDQRISFNAQLEVLKSLNPQSELRLQIIKDLNDEYPDLIKGLDLEKASLEDINTLQQTSNELLLAEILIRRHEEEIADASERRSEAAENLITAQENLTKAEEEGLGVSLSALRVQGNYSSGNEFLRSQLTEATREFNNANLALEDLTSTESDAVGQAKLLLQANEDSITSFNVLQSVLPEVNQAFIPFIDANAQATAASEGLTSAEKRRIDVMGASMNLASNATKSLGALGKAGKAHAKDIANVQAAAAMIDAFSAAQASRTQVAKILPPPAPAIAYGLSLTAGLANAAMVREESIKMAAEGMNEVVTEPTLILAGEAGPEYVDIEPTTNEGAGRGGATVIFQGNVMSDEFIEEEAIPKIKEALRRGSDIGIS